MKLLRSGIPTGFLRDKMVFKRTKQRDAWMFRGTLLFGILVCSLCWYSFMGNRKMNGSLITGLAILSFTSSIERMKHNRTLFH